jgi:hypothetical protein
MLKHTTYERSEPIPIKQSNTTSMKEESEYSLKQNCFDPTKCSPPNEFMIKLRMRMKRYYFSNNDDNFDTK